MFESFNGGGRLGGMNVHHLDLIGVDLWGYDEWC